MRAVRVPTIDDVTAAHAVISRILQPTPLVESPALGEGVVLKLETTQPTGSFKVRGALSAIAGHPAQPVVTASAGNHGLGVAYAATTFGASATVVVPENASTAKRAALDAFDITLAVHGSSYSEAEAHALTLAGDGVRRFVSPYNDPDTIAGQATIAVELFEQRADLSTIVVPIGGGGLASGVGLAASTRPHVRIIGVEATASPAMKAALAGTGPITIAPTLADGLAGNLEDGTVTVDICRRFVDDIVTVTEDEIRAGMRYLAREHGLVVEGSAAVGVAALLNGSIATASGVTAVVVTGRNIALDTFADAIRS